MGILPGAKYNISLLTLHSETGKAPYDVSMGSQNPPCVGFFPKLHLLPDFQSHQSVPQSLQPMDLGDASSHQGLM